MWLTVVGGGLQGYLAEACVSNQDQLDWKRRQQEHLDGDRHVGEVLVGGGGEGGSKEGLEVREQDGGEDVEQRGTLSTGSSEEERGICAGIGLRGLRETGQGMCRGCMGRIQVAAAMWTEVVAVVAVLVAGFCGREGRWQGR